MSLGKNTQFKIGDGGGTEVFTQVSHTTLVDHAGSSWATEDTTNHDAATAVKTLQTTILDNKSFKLTISPFSSVDTQHARMRTRSLDGASNNFKVVFPSGGGETWSFAGYVTDWKFDTPVAGLLKAQCTVMINGAITIT